MKRLYYFSFLMLALLLPATAIAHDFEVDGIYYNINNSNEATVVGSSKSGNVGFPETVTNNGMTYTVTSIGNYAFVNRRDLTSVTIPNTVNYIGECAFARCNSLMSAIIGESVTYIGYEAFDECTSLDVLYFNAVSCADFDAYDDSWYDPFFDLNVSKLYIGDSVQRIPAFLANNWHNLSIVNIGCSVATIGRSAFCNCSELTSITFPNSVTSIGYNALEGTGWYNNQPDGLVYAGQVAYKFKGGMQYGTSITLNNGTLGVAGGAFENCYTMTDITIPNTVTSICQAAFFGCSGLTNVTIPNSVTEIGDDAFERCSALNDVYCNIINPSIISMGSSVFKQHPMNYANRTLHVPQGSVAAYQADTKWSEFFGSIVEMEPEAVLAESIKLNVTTAGLNEGATLQLTATVLPEGASSESVIWASNNPSVATVDSNGLVTTHGVGTATITAITTDGSNLSTTCTVTLLPVGVKGDVNGDSNINISDVTKLIDYLLSGSWN